MNIKLRAEDKIRILNGDDLFRVMQRILAREEQLDLDKEHFWIAGLNNHNMLIFVELISLGNISSYPVNPMDAFRVGVLKGAVRVAMVHNHPSGNVNVSAADKEVTDRLIQVGLILNIEVFDHVIISLKSFFSFNDIGLMRELAKSIKWKLRDEQEEQLRIEYEELMGVAKRKAYEIGKDEGKEDGIEIGVKKGEKIGFKKGEKSGIEKEKIQIAKMSIKEGLPVEQIAKLTGLSKAEIGKLSVRNR